MTIQELIAGANLSRAQLNQLKRNLATLNADRLRGLTEDVARAEEGSIMTRAGLDILAKGIAGKLIKFTRVAIGDSMQNDELVTPTDEQILNFTDLIDPLQDIPIIGCKSGGDGTAVVQAYLRNVDFQSGLWVREIGLFAQDPDTSQEVLYSYKNSGVLSSYAPSGQGAVLVNRQVNLVTVVQNAQNITAVIDASTVFVNQAQLLEHVNDSNPHPNLEILTADDVLELAADATAQLNDRLNQAEVNITNLFTQLGTPDANLLIYEDFKELDGVDDLKVKVISAASNSNVVEVETLDGIIAGHYYVLADGVRSTFFRADALISDNGTYSVVFNSNANHSFNLNRTYLYRSTATIGDGVAFGSAKEKESAFAPDDVFTGAAATTLILNTTQKRAADFELTGSGSFTADGFFTLA